MNKAVVVIKGNHPIDDHLLDDWQHLSSINVDGTVLRLQAAVRAMKQQGQGGAIADLGSAAVQVGIACCINTNAVHTGYM